MIILVFNKLCLYSKMADIYDRWHERDTTSGSSQSDKLFSRYQLKTPHAHNYALSTCYGNTPRT